MRLFKSKEEKAMKKRGVSFFRGRVHATYWKNPKR